MRLSLVPKSSGFYELFAKAGENALEVARKAETRFREWPNPSTTQDDINDLEHRGDDLTKEIIQLLNTQYVTPFDREDIYELAGRLDNVVDHIYHATELLSLYSVELPSRAAIEQCAILVRACEQLALGLADLKGQSTLESVIDQLQYEEDEGDRVVRNALADLFDDSRIDPLMVIRWKDIHEGLEAAINSAQAVGSVLGNIVVKST